MTDPSYAHTDQPAAGNTRDGQKHTVGPLAYAGSFDFHNNSLLAGEETGQRDYITCLVPQNITNFKKEGGI